MDTSSNNSTSIKKKNSFSSTSSFSSFIPVATAASDQKQQQQRYRNHRRLSVPSTIQSTMVATTEHAKQRRLSLRRSLSKDSIITSSESSTSSNNNNKNSHNHNKKQKVDTNNSKAATKPTIINTKHPFHYSPPETRSARKKKMHDEFMNNEINNHKVDVSGTLLQFSPPNQKENEQREQERIRKQEYERAKRINNARNDGNLLVFSPSNRRDDAYCLDLTPGGEEEKPSPIQKKTKNISFTTTPNIQDVVTTSHTTNLTTANHDSTMTNEINDTSSLTTNSTTTTAAAASATDEHHKIFVQAVKDSSREVLEKMEEMHNATATSLQKSAKYEEQIQHLKETIKMKEEMFEHDKMVFKGKIEELQNQQVQSKRIISSIESEKSRLIDELKDLENRKTCTEQEKERLANEVEELEQQLLQMKEKLQNDIDVAKHLQNQHDTDILVQNANQQMQLNETLQQQLLQADGKNKKLQSEIESKEQIIHRLEKVTIPELKSLLENEKDALARIESKLETSNNEISMCKEQILKLEKENYDYKIKLENLQKHIDELEQKEQEQSRTKSVEIDAFNKIKTEAEEKDRTISSLKAQLQQQRVELETELNELANANERLEQGNVKMTKQQKDLNDALEETMEKLDATEKEKAEFEANLAKALKQLHDVNTFAGNCDIKMVDLQKQLTEEREASKVIVEEKERIVKEHKEQAHKIRRLEMERDMDRQHMEGFDSREAELIRKLNESDRIRRAMHSQIMQLVGKIRVFVRVRPPLPEELQSSSERKRQDLTKSQQKRKRGIEEENNTPFRFPGVYDRSHNQSSVDDLTKSMIDIIEPAHGNRVGLSNNPTQTSYQFDGVFPPEAKQEDVWDEVEPLVQSAVDGFNVTILAYGQTGSGKTYTMLGDENCHGIIGRSVQKVFQAKESIEDLSRGETKVTIKVELVEVYNETIRDLLSKKDNKAVTVTSKGVEGNKVIETATEQEVMDCLKIAQSRRCVKATKLNNESSRSHMIFTLHFCAEGGSINRIGKLNICDLAGSERVDKSGANDAGKEALFSETKNINQSLRVLSNVIEKLQAGEKIIPYRESKLTMLLKNSLCGNSKTLAIVCCSPLLQHVNESKNSLIFAEKINRVDLKAKANVQH